MPSRTQVWYGIVVTALLGPSLAAQENGSKDWPVFRGNGAQTGVAASALPDNLAVSWSFKSQDAIEGSPIIAADTVYVGSLDGKFYALDLKSGQKKWEYQTGGIKTAAAARDGAVYVGDIKGIFHCIDAATGKKRWTVATKGAIHSPANFAGDNIVFGCYDHHLYCVSGAGKVLWQCKTKEKLHGAAAVAGDRVLIAGCDKALHVVDLAKGNEVLAVPLGGHIAASPAVHGDRLYIGNMDSNQFMAIDWKKGDVLWKFEAKRNPQPFYSSAAITDELVVAGSRDKLVRAWKRQTGAEVWTFATKGRVDSSPLIVDKRVIVGSLDGHLYIIDLSRGTEQARFNLGPINGSAAVGGQCLVVASFRGEIFCLAAKK
jgi:outer membrane protein assembly factor BamB